MILPAPSGASSLPQYANQATFLKPQHCRLCLQEVSDLEEHLLEVHADASTLEEYRLKVFRKVVSEWPQEISPQVLRCRLAAFKDKMTDQNFEMLACASCTRQERRCKLRSVNFPPSNGSQRPSWLRCSEQEWKSDGVHWRKQIDKIFDIESYLKDIFKVDEIFKSADVTAHW